MKNKGSEIRIIIQVILVVLSFLLGGALMLLFVHFHPVNKAYNIVKDETKIYEKNSLAKAVDKIYNAVVVVENYEGKEVSTTGTGFIYKTDQRYGYLLTNEHVVRGKSLVKVLMATDEEVDAKVLGSDKYLDLAVLRIDKKYVSQVAVLGSSEKMSLGDTVFSVGSPVGSTYNGTVTSGILSGKDRLVSLSIREDVDDDNWVMKVLQTDAPLNPGNSGGPLLNTNGEVIGICTLKLVNDDIEGMAFAIPIEYAMSHIKSLESGTKINWPVLGIGMANVNDANIALYNVKNVKDKKGVIVTKVNEKSSASKAGLKAGDIIIKINDNIVADKAHLRYELYKYQKNDQIEITYVREGRKKQIKTQLG